MSNTGNKSISELEGWKWKDEIPLENDSYVVRNFYRLHSYPIKKYDLSDLRFMISQNSGLNYLVPIALMKLKNDLFIEAELYPGDLFCSLLLIDSEPNYWKLNTKEKEELIDLYTKQRKNLGAIDVNDEIIQKIKDTFMEFLSK